jgi:transitional endoplasmic reticulum ATPase
MSKSIVRLKVRKAKKRDSDRSITRIDQAAMDKLKVKTGDIILLNGKNTTTGVVWPAYPQDSGLNMIRLDWLLRKNVGCVEGDEIEIEKAEIKIAKSIILAPSDVKIRSNPRFETFIKRRLVNHPVTLFDLVKVSIGISREILFKVIDLQPSGACLIRNETLLHISEKPTTSEAEDLIGFRNIGGLDSQIKEIELILDLNKIELTDIEEKRPLKNENVIKGILLSGPPGTGKTLLMKAIANEVVATSRHIISLNGTDIMSSYQGESEQKLRKIFDEAQERSPSIIFIDHIDAIAPKISEQMLEIGRHLEHRLISQLLGLIDGIQSRGDIIVVGATNKLELIEPALLRPGRIDKIIDFSLPNFQERIEILKIHVTDLEIDEKVSIEDLAKRMEDFTGADISGVCKLATYNAHKRGQVQKDSSKNVDFKPEIIVNLDDFIDAIEEIHKRIQLNLKE